MSRTDIWELKYAAEKKAQALVELVGEYHVIREKLDRANKESEIALDAYLVALKKEEFPDPVKEKEPPVTTGTPVEPTF